MTNTSLKVLFILCTDNLNTIKHLKAKILERKIPLFKETNLNWQLFYIKSIIIELEIDIRLREAIKILDLVLIGKRSFLKLY